MNSIDHLNTTLGGRGLVPFADRLESSLTPIGALNLLGVALRIAPQREVVRLCEAFLGSLSAGYPTPALLSVYDDAKWHASIATPNERKAYCLAHYQAMDAGERARFQAYITDKREAA